MGSQPKAPPASQGLACVPVPRGERHARRALTTPCAHGSPRSRISAQRACQQGAGQGGSERQEERQVHAAKCRLHSCRGAGPRQGRRPLPGGCSACPSPPARSPCSPRQQHPVKASCPPTHLAAVDPHIAGGPLVPAGRAAGLCRVLEVVLSPRHDRLPIIVSILLGVALLGHPRRPCCCACGTACRCRRCAARCRCCCPPCCS